MPKEPQPQPQPVNNNQPLTLGVLTLILATLIVWAGKSISDQGDQIIRLEVSQGQLIKTVEKMSENVEEGLGNSQDLTGQMRALGDRVDRQWQAFRNEIRSGE